MMSFLAAALVLLSPVSPVEVLARSEHELGSRGVGFPYRPGDRTPPADDHTLAPYFYVPGADAETERLPLKETSAQVDIAGVIAQVKLRQVFANEGKRPIEAVYVFPAS